MTCRVCDNEPNFTFSFGPMPIANAFLTKDQLAIEYFYEMAVAFCSDCKMFQLIDQPKPEVMFHENYAFFSSTSRAMASHFEAMAKTYMSHFIVDKQDAFVIELGCNDGIMLKHFANNGIKHLGIEPSANVAAVAQKNNVNTLCDFFGEAVAQKVKKEYGKADIISAANVMCHIPDLHSVAKGVNSLLKERGVFVFEEPYLGDVIQKTSYDQIYDEHVYIFSAESVSNAFSSYDLELFHVEPQSTHGGSMRYYLCRKGAHLVRDSVREQLNYEIELGLDNVETYKKFADKCESNKTNLVSLLTQLKSEGKRVVGYAATSKSTTVLNYCDIGPDLIEYICDTTPIKQGKYSPGKHIPIKSYEEFKSDKPDYAILFAWNHAREIFAKEDEFISLGGQWIMFVPEIKILKAKEGAML